MHDIGHPHDHDHDHDHAHDCGACAGSCESCDKDPKAELLALMAYMVKHNKSHCAELEALAKQLKGMGMDQACEQVLAAVGDFEKGNLRLSAVLSSIQA